MHTLWRAFSSKENDVGLHTIVFFFKKEQIRGFGGEQSPSSVITMSKILHQALAYAVKERLIAVNPCAGVSLPTAEKREAHPLTVEQAQHLLQEV